MLSGLGAMVWKIREWKRGDPQAQVKHAKDLGLSWLSLKVIDGTLEKWEGSIPDQNADLIPALVPELVEAGITVIGWGWTYGRSTVPPFLSIAETEAKTTAQVMRKYGALGMSPIYQVDAEHHYRRKGLRMEQEADKYMRNLLDAAPDLELLLCSYRFPLTSQPDFPTRTFMRFSSGASPQVYWMLDDRPDGGADQLERSFNQYKNINQTPFVPIGPIYAQESGPRKGWRATKEQLQSFLSKAKALGCGGAGVWALDTASSEQLEAVAEFDWKPKPKRHWSDLPQEEFNNLIVEGLHRLGLIDGEGFIRV